MLSRRSYVRLFTMAVLLAGSYAGLRADEGGPVDCGSNNTIQCFGGQVRDAPALQQFCNSSCSACEMGPSTWNYTYDGDPEENGQGCNWVLWCLCGELE